MSNTDSNPADTAHRGFTIRHRHVTVYRCNTAAPNGRRWSVQTIRHNGRTLRLVWAGPAFVLVAPVR